MLCWSKGSLRGLPLSQQTVCLKLVVGGGGKKGSLHKTVSLELASQLERKMVTCSFFFFLSVLQIHLPYEQQQSTVGFYCMLVFEFL